MHKKWIRSVGYTCKGVDVLGSPFNKGSLIWGPSSQKMVGGFWGTVQKWIGVFGSHAKEDWYFYAPLPEKKGVGESGVPFNNVGCVMLCFVGQMDMGWFLCRHCFILIYAALIDIVLLHIYDGCCCLCWYCFGVFSIVLLFVFCIVFGCVWLCLIVLNGLV